MMRTMDEIEVKRAELMLSAGECNLFLNLANEYPSADQDDSEILEMSHQSEKLNRMVALLDSVLDNPDEIELYDRLVDLESRVKSLRLSIERISDTEDEDMLQELEWRIDDLGVLDSEYRLLRWVLGISGHAEVI